jgi:hypothetical protein
MLYADGELPQPAARSELGRRCRLSFVKVAEFQRRGVVHFHALIRLDGPGDDFAASRPGLDAGDLAAAIVEAAARSDTSSTCRPGRWR